MKFNFNKKADFDKENLDNIWVVDMWLDNMDSKDGHDHIEFTKIGLIDFLNNEMENYNSTNGADFTALDRNATNKEVEEVLYDLFEGKVVEIKPYNEKSANKKVKADRNGEKVLFTDGDWYVSYSTEKTGIEDNSLGIWVALCSAADNTIFNTDYVFYTDLLSEEDFVDFVNDSDKIATDELPDEKLQEYSEKATEMLIEKLANYKEGAEKEPKEKIDVLFKLEPLDKIGIDGLDVVAWFVNEPDCCYAHVGQHSSCDPEYMASLEDAKFTDYEYLLRELESIGYEVNVMNGDYKQQKKASRKFTFIKKKAGEEIDKVNLDFMKDTEDTSYALKLLRDGIVTRESRHFDKLVENILNDGEGSAAPLTLLSYGILNENDRYYHNAVKQCLQHPTYAASLLERGIITKDSEYYIDAVNSAIRYGDIAKSLVEKGIIDEQYVKDDNNRRKEQLRSALSEAILTLRESGERFYDLRLVWQDKESPEQELKQALDVAANRLDKAGMKEEADYYRGVLKQASKKVKAENEETENYITVWLYPGSGASLYGFATVADNEEEALENVADYLVEKQLHSFYMTPQEYQDFMKDFYNDLSEEELEEKMENDETVMYVDTGRGAVVYLTGFENAKIEKGINENYIDDIAIIDGNRAKSGPLSKWSKQASKKVKSELNFDGDLFQIENIKFDVNTLKSKCIEKEKGESATYRFEIAIQPDKYIVSNDRGGDWVQLSGKCFGEYVSYAGDYGASAKEVFADWPQNCEFGGFFSANGNKINITYKGNIAEYIGDGVAIYIQNATLNVPTTEKNTASLKRKAGTGNFSTQEGYPLIAIGDEQVYPIKSYIEDYNENNPEEPITEEDMADHYEDYGDILTDLYREVTNEMETYLKNADIPYGWNITIESGYYEGAQLYVEEPDDFEYNFENDWLYDNELAYGELTPEQKAELQNATQAQFEKEKAQVIQIMHDAAKACGWLELAVAYRFSNGETGYSIVK